MRRVGRIRGCSTFLLHFPTHVVAKMVSSIERLRSIHSAEHHRSPHHWSCRGVKDSRPSSWPVCRLSARIAKAHFLHPSRVASCVQAASDAGQRFERRKRRLCNCAGALAFAATFWSRVSTASGGEMSGYTRKCGSYSDPGEPWRWLWI